MDVAVLLPLGLAIATHQGPTTTTPENTPVGKIYALFSGLLVTTQKNLGLIIFLLGNHGFMQAFIQFGILLDTVLKIPVVEWILE